MVRVKIKRIGTRTGTAGLHFGGPKTRRALRPNEVVELSEDFPKLDEFLDSDKLEITRDPVTRPLDFETEIEATYSDPQFKTIEQSTRDEVLRVREEIARKLEESQKPVKKKGRPPKAKEDTEESFENATFSP